MSNLKITYIGGGSQQWALQLMADLSLSKYLSGELVLHDIDNVAALKNKDIGDVIFLKNKEKPNFTITVEPNLEAALNGADFVVISIEPGPIESRYIDLKIPEKYGIFQSVGDTTGPGGIARAIRTIPTMANFAHKIMDICPNAWVINYTNPMAWCMGALYQAEPNIKAVGCCHEVFGTQEFLANWISHRYQVELPRREEIVMDIAGVNHFTFATSVTWNGENIIEKLLSENSDVEHNKLKENVLKRIESEDWFNSEGMVALNFLRDFGVLGAAGDRHLAEFVPWYLSEKDELNYWGVSLTPYEWRVKRTKTQDIARQKFIEAPLSPSGEEGVLIIEALSGNIASCRTNINIPNYGQNAQLPRGGIIESYGHLSKDKLEPILCGKLPDSINSIVHNNLIVQKLVLDGVMSKDKGKIFSGFLLDPLVSITPRKAKELFNEIWEALDVKW